jgi:hypothetical protein
MQRFELGDSGMESIGHTGGLFGSDGGVAGDARMPRSPADPAFDGEFGTESTSEFAHLTRRYRRSLKAGHCETREIGGTCSYYARRCKEVLL